MIFSLKTLLAVCIFINLFLAWWYANDRNICKVVIFCTAKGWSLDDIMRMNIDKLKERYPDGFDVERANHRKAGDI